MVAAPLFSNINDWAVWVATGVLCSGAFARHGLSTAAIYWSLTAGASVADPSLHSLQMLNLAAVVYDLSFELHRLYELVHATPRRAHPSARRTMRRQPGATPPVHGCSASRLRRCAAQVSHRPLLICAIVALALLAERRVGEQRQSKAAVGGRAVVRWVQPEVGGWERQPLPRPGRPRDAPRVAVQNAASSS